MSSTAGSAPWRRALSHALKRTRHPVELYIDSIRPLEEQARACYEGGVLTIPVLHVHDGTMSLFMNLLAFEQCHVHCSNDVTSYLIFMDNLIDSEHDVSYLRSRGILGHGYGNDGQVADLFKRRCKEVVLDINRSYLFDLSVQVRDYSSVRRHAWRATLKRDYFGNPSAIVSVIAAVVLLGLTFVQTFFTVYPYYRPNS